MSAAKSAAAAAAAAAAEPGKKRARYTSVACNECKRRKIKCNGEKPCERCGNQDLECVYASHDFQDSDEYRRMSNEIGTLQGQVKELYQIVAQLRLQLQGASGGTANPASGATAMPVAEIPAEVETELLGGGESMCIDMSHKDGRIEFVEQRENPLLDHPDPLVAMCRRDVVRLLAIFTTQIHPIWPIITVEDILWRLDIMFKFREAIAKSGLSQMPIDPLSIREGAEDDAAIIIKMALAIAAETESMVGNPWAEKLYNNVREIYQRRGYPPAMLPAGEDGEPEATQVVRERRWQENCIRMRLLQALWHFQKGEAEVALAEVTEARRAFDRDFHNVKLQALEATSTTRLGKITYTMYWIFRLLLKTEGRMDLTIDKGPALIFTDDYEQDEEGTLRSPLFEYARITSLISFAFEIPKEAHSILDNARPPWSDDLAVDHVHRWQTTFADGLRSMSAVRLVVLSQRTPQERTVQSAIYLLANYLRLAVCQYKCSFFAADQYHGPIDEYCGSAKYAQDSLNVLWNVHKTATTWNSHWELYNRFLLQAAAWLYKLLSNRTILLIPEVKISLERALALLETYAREWPMAEAMLQKLRESRHHGVLNEAV